MKLVCPKCGWVGDEQESIVLDTWEACLPVELRMNDALDVTCCPECETPVEKYKECKGGRFFVLDPESYKENQLSVWQNQDVRPLLSGVYEVCSYVGEALNKRIYAHWINSCWSTASSDPNEVLNNPVKWHGCWVWRGLKSKQ